MIGLPGQTLKAMEDDLAFYFDSGMEVQQFRTVMLPNSPMAEPAYRELHQIQASPDGLVTSTSTMSQHEFHIATLVARQFYAIHHLGLIRYPLVFLQREHGLKALDVMHALAEDEPMLRERFPLLAEVSSTKGYLYDVSVSHHGFLEKCRAGKLWSALHDQMIAWVSERFGIQRTPEWDLVARVQETVMPTADRTFPHSIALEHDVVRWYVDGRAGNPAPLSSYAPGVLAVEDPLEMCSKPYREIRTTRLIFELASPLARARIGEMGTAYLARGLGMKHPDVSLSWLVSPTYAE